MTSVFADRITDYLLTRTVPWKEPDEIRDAVREAIRLTFSEASHDPDNPLRPYLAGADDDDVTDAEVAEFLAYVDRKLDQQDALDGADDYRDELQSEARQVQWEDDGLDR